MTNLEKIKKLNSGSMVELLSNWEPEAADRWYCKHKCPNRDKCSGDCLDDLTTKETIKLFLEEDYNETTHDYLTGEA